MKIGTKKIYWGDMVSIAMILAVVGLVVAYLVSKPTPKPASPSPQVALSKPAWTNKSGQDRMTDEKWARGCAIARNTIVAESYIPASASEKIAPLLCIAFSEQALTLWIDMRGTKTTCRQAPECEVRMRLDDAPAFNIKARTKAQHFEPDELTISTEWYSQNGKLNGLPRAKKLLIDLPVRTQGPGVLEYDLNGLETPSWWTAKSAAQ